MCCFVGEASRTCTFPTYKFTVGFWAPRSTRATRPRTSCGHVALNSMVWRMLPRGMVSTRADTCRVTGMGTGAEACVCMRLGIPAACLPARLLPWSPAKHKHMCA